MDESPQISTRPLDDSLQIQGVRCTECGRVREQTDTCICEYVREDDAAQVLAKLRQGTSPDSVDQRGRTLLHEAVLARASHVAAMLLRAGAVPNVADMLLHTPYALALRDNNQEIIRLLETHMEKMRIAKFSHTRVCNACGNEAGAKCGKCGHSWYCSRECQVKNWPAHKGHCKLYQSMGKRLEEQLTLKRQWYNKVEGWLAYDCAPAEPSSADLFVSSSGIFTKAIFTGRTTASSYVSLLRICSQFQDRPGYALSVVASKPALDMDYVKALRFPLQHPRLPEEIKFSEVISLTAGPDLLRLVCSCTSAQAYTRVLDRTVTLEHKALLCAMLSCAVNPQGGSQVPENILGHPLLTTAREAPKDTIRACVCVCVKAVQQRQDPLVLLLILSELVMPLVVTGDTEIQDTIVRTLTDPMNGALEAVVLLMMRPELWLCESAVRIFQCIFGHRESITLLNTYIEAHPTTRVFIAHIIAWVVENTPFEAFPPGTNLLGVSVPETTTLAFAYMCARMMYELVSAAGKNPLAPQIFDRSVLRKLLLSQIETHKDVPSISGVALESLHNSLSKEETELIASMIKTHSFVEDAPPAGLPEGFEGFLSWPTLACAFSVLQSHAQNSARDPPKFVHFGLHAAVCTVSFAFLFGHAEMRSYLDSNSAVELYVALLDNPCPRASVCEAQTRAAADLAFLIEKQRDEGSGLRYNLLPHLCEHLLKAVTIFFRRMKDIPQSVFRIHFRTETIPYMLQLTTAISHSYDEERCETSMLEIVATYDTLSAIADAVTSALASTTEDAVQKLSNIYICCAMTTMLAIIARLNALSDQPPYTMPYECMGGQFESMLRQFCLRAEPSELVEEARTFLRNVESVVQEEAETKREPLSRAKPKSQKKAKKSKTQR